MKAASRRFAAKHARSEPPACESDGDVVAGGDLGAVGDDDVGVGGDDREAALQDGQRAEGVQRGGGAGEPEPRGLDEQVAALVQRELGGREPATDAGEAVARVLREQARVELSEAATVAREAGARVLLVEGSSRTRRLVASTRRRSMWPSRCW